MSLARDKLAEGKIALGLVEKIIVLLVSLAGLFNTFWRMRTEKVFP